MKDVFDAYPHVDAIYVVDGMPFLEYAAAVSHAHGMGDAVTRVSRSRVEQPPAPKGEMVDAEMEVDAETEVVDAEIEVVDAESLEAFLVGKGKGRKAKDVNPMP